MHIFKNVYGLLIFNQNNFPSLLQLISSLMMWSLAWGRGNLSLTWHHSNSKPQPINS